MFPIDFLHKAAAAAPQAIAVDDGQRVLSFGETVTRAHALAAGLQALTGKDRLKVGICGHNTLEQFLALLAIHAAGGILVPLNPRSARPELESVLERLRPDVVVADAAYADIYEVHRDLATVVGHEGDGARSVHALVEARRGDRASWPRVARSDVNGIKLTGGSSGVPKGVMQSFRCVNTLVASILLTFDFARGDAYLCAPPITHGAGSFVLPMLARGGRIVLLENTKGETVLDALLNAGITHTWAPPTLVYAVMEAGGGRTPLFPALRGMLFGGAPMPSEKVREARSFFAGCIGTMYGQTEASTVVTGMTPAEFADEANLASVGRVTLLTKAEIRGPQDQALPAGEAGEIVVSGDLVMNGYYEMPGETAKTLVDGWLRTGDIGMFDERGYLFLKDRLRDVVISGGFNVYPSDVENALAQHDAVYECVVYGAPDPKWGERVEAVVQLRPGREASPEAIIAFAKERVGSVKAPKVVHIVADLPRSPVGKVLRREAKAMLMKENVS